MRITEIITEDQLTEGPRLNAIGRGIGNVVGGAAKAAGAVAGGAVGAWDAAKKGFAAGRSNVARGDDDEDAATSGGAGGSVPAASGRTASGTATGGSTSAAPAAANAAAPTTASAAAPVSGDEVDSIIAAIDKLDPARKKQIADTLSGSPAPAPSPAADSTATPAPSPATSAPVSAPAAAANPEPTRAELDAAWADAVADSRSNSAPAARPNYGQGGYGDVRMNAPAGIPNPMTNTKPVTAPAAAPTPPSWADPKSSDYVGRREVARRQQADPSKPVAAPAAAPVAAPAVPTIKASQDKNNAAAAIKAINGRTVDVKESDLIAQLRDKLDQLN